MPQQRNNVQIHVKAGNYLFVFKMSEDDLDDLMKRSEVCGLPFDLFLMRKMFGPDPEEFLGIDAGPPVETYLAEWSHTPDNRSKRPDQCRLAAAL